MKCRRYHIIRRVKQFLHKSERCEVMTDIYHWTAGLAVTGRVCDIGRDFVESYFQTGSGSNPSYFHISFLITLLEEAIIRNIIIILCINCIIALIIIIIYARLQNFILFLEILMGTRKDFFEIYRQFGHAPSKSLTSPGRRT
jgi:hypothetical protein